MKHFVQLLCMNPTWGPYISDFSPSFWCEILNLWIICTNRD